MKIRKIRQKIKNNCKQVLSEILLEYFSVILYMIINL